MPYANGKSLVEWIEAKAQVFPHGKLRQKRFVALRDGNHRQVVRTLSM
jgi:hypothetical protein